MMPHRVVRRCVIGLILEPGVVHIAQVTDEHQPRLLRVTSQPITDASPPAIADAIRRIVSARLLARSTITIALPRRHVLLRPLLLPSHAPDELAAMVQRQAERHLPCPRDHLMTDYLPIEQRNGRMSVLAVFALRATLARPLAVCERLGVSPQRVLVTGQALLDWYRAMHPACVAGDAPVALLDVSREMSELVVVARGRLQWTFAWPHGRERWLALVDEIARAVSSSRQDEALAAVRHLYVTSASPPLAPLAEALTERLGWACEVMDVTLPPSVGDEDGYSPVTVCGAALYPREARVNLLPQEIRMRQRQMLRRRRMYRTAVLAGALCLTAGLAVTQRHVQRAAYLQALREQALSLEGADRRLAVTTRRLRAITAYLATRAQPLQLLHALDGLVPPEVSLTELTFEEERGLRLRAVAPSMESALALMQRLQAAPLFAGVEMTLATQRVIRSTTVVDVELHCRLASTQP